MKLKTAQIIGVMSLGMILGEVRGGHTDSDLPTGIQQVKNEPIEVLLVNKLRERSKKIQEKVNENNLNEVSKQDVIKLTDLMLNFLCKIFLIEEDPLRPIHQDFSQSWKLIKRFKLSSKEVSSGKEIVCTNTNQYPSAYEVFMSEESDDYIKISKGYSLLIKGEEIGNNDWINVMGSMILGKLIKAASKEEHKEDKFSSEECKLMYSIFKRLSEIWGQNINTTKLDGTTIKEELFALYNDADLCIGLPKALLYQERKKSKADDDQVKEDLNQKRLTFFSKNKTEEKRLAAERLLKQLGMIEYPISVEKYTVDNLVCLSSGTPSGEYDLTDIYNRFAKSHPELGIKETSATDISSSFADFLKKQNEPTRIAFEEYINPLKYRTSKIRIDALKELFEKKMSAKAVQKTISYEDALNAVKSEYSTGKWKKFNESKINEKIKIWIKTNGYKLKE